MRTVVHTASNVSTERIAGAVCVGFAGIVVAVVFAALLQPTIRLRNARGAKSARDNMEPRVRAFGVRISEFKDRDRK